MFSGIIETTAKVRAASDEAGMLRVQVERPAAFSDLSVGDSIACNGVCLTAETLSESQMSFAIGLETQAVTGWSKTSVLQQSWNLERSLRFGDRVHGHLVTGHVDGLVEVVEIRKEPEWQWMQLRAPVALVNFIWFKGSVALNGVSLTVNSVQHNLFTVGLIPETLKRTNLGQVAVGQSLHLEVDNMARGLVHNLRLSGEDKRELT